MDIHPPCKHQKSRRKPIFHGSNRCPFLAVFAPEATAGMIYLVPFQLDDFPQTTASECQKPGCVDRLFKFALVR